MGKLLIQGKLYSPIKVGDPGDWYENEPNGVCGDCGERYGEQHMPQCDVERCPACGGQMLSCDCGPVFDVDEDIDKETLSKLIEKQKYEIVRSKMIITFDRNSPSGNIYSIISSAQQELKKHRPNLDFREVTDRVYASENYNDALKIIDEYVTLIDLTKPQRSM